MTLPVAIRAGAGSGAWNGDASPYADNSPIMTSGGGTITFVFGGTPESCSRTIPFTNHKLTMQRAYWRLNGNNIYVEDVPPGETRTHTISPEDCDDYTVELVTVDLMLNEDFELVPSTNVLDQVSNETGDSTNSVTSYFRPPFEIDAAGALDSTNGRAPVIFSAAAGTNSSRAIQEGFTGMLLSQQQMDGETLRLLDAIRQNTQITATNTSPNNIDPEQHLADAVALGAVGSNSVMGFTDAFTLDGSDIGTGAMPDLTVSIGAHVIDLNPLNIPLIATFAEAVRLFLVWLTNILFVVACFKVVKDKMMPLLTPSIAGFTLGGPVGTVLKLVTVAIGTASMIAGAAVVILTYATTNSFFTAAMTHPFGSGLWASSMTIFTQFVPVAHMMACFVAWLVFEVSATAIVIGVSIAMRAASVVALILAGAQLTNAAELRLSNMTATNLTVGALAVPPGTHWLSLPATSYTLDDGDGTASLTVPAGDVTVQTAVVWSTGTGPACSDASANLLDAFWLGFTVAGGIWGFGVSRALLGKLRGAAE